ARLIRQVAAALDAAHAAGVMPCDVKPANVIVDREGLAKLTDFGIARAARDRDEQELLGTARYIAPERVEGGPVTARTDVYGLGLVAYELLTGRPAFDGATSEELVRERLLGPPPSLRLARVGIDDRLDAIVGRGRRAPVRRVPGRRVGSRAGAGESVCRSPAGPAGRHSAGARRENDPLVRPGKRLHEERGLGLGARTAARTDTGRVRENNE